MRQVGAGGAALGAPVKLVVAGCAVADVLSATYGIIHYGVVVALGIALEFEALGQLAQPRGRVWGLWGRRRRRCP